MEDKVNPRCGSEFVLAPCEYKHCSNPECKNSYKKNTKHCRKDHK